jgi:hypothetical protein
MADVIVNTPAVCAKRAAPPFVLIKPLAPIIWGGRTTRTMGFTEHLFCSGPGYAAQCSCDFQPQFPQGRCDDPVLSLFLAHGKPWAFFYKRRSTRLKPTFRSCIKRFCNYSGLPAACGNVGEDKSKREQLRMYPVSYFEVKQKELEEIGSPSVNYRYLGRTRTVMAQRRRRWPIKMTG